MSGHMHNGRGGFEQVGFHTISSITCIIRSIPLFGQMQPQGYGLLCCCPVLYIIIMDAGRYRALFVPNALILAEPPWQLLVPF